MCGHAAGLALQGASARTCTRTHTHVCSQHASVVDLNCQELHRAQERGTVNSPVTCPFATKLLPKHVDGVGRAGVLKAAGSQSTLCTMHAAPQINAHIAMCSLQYIVVSESMATASNHARHLGCKLALSQ